jgi:hypothetical protein
VSRGKGERIRNFLLNQRIYGNNILRGCVEIRQRIFLGKPSASGVPHREGFIFSSSLSPFSPHGREEAGGLFLSYRYIVVVPDVVDNFKQAVFST